MMVWAAGIMGFICGFAAGIFCLKRWLADRNKEQLMTDKGLHRTYGLFVWILAAATSAAAVWLYKYYMP